MPITTSGKPSLDPGYVRCFPEEELFIIIVQSLSCLVVNEAYCWHGSPQIWFVVYRTAPGVIVVLDLSLPQIRFMSPWHKVTYIKGSLPVACYVSVYRRLQKLDLFEASTHLNIVLGPRQCQSNSDWLPLRAHNPGFRGVTTNYILRHQELLCSSHVSGLLTCGE